MSRGRPRTAIGTFGEISISDLGGRYRALTRYRDLDGRLRKVTATGRTARVAQARLKQKLADRDRQGDSTLSVASSFGRLSDLWLIDLALREISEGTKDNYRDDLRLHIRPVFDGYTLGEITTGRVEWFLRREAAVSWSRAKHSRTVLQQMFAFAVRHDALARNPVQGTSPLSRPQREIHALTLDQIQAIRTAAAAWRTGPRVRGPRPDGTVRDIIEVLLGTSMRPGEVLALRPCDVSDGDAGMVVHVRGTVVRRKGQRDFRQHHPKTDASARDIAVPEFAAVVIRRRVAVMGPDEQEVTIFHNRREGVITLHNLRRTFREFLRDSGLAQSGITLRWYRRTGATVLARGLGIEAAAAYLGHTSPAITEGHYVAPDRAVDRSPAAILERTLRPTQPDGVLLVRPESASELDVLERIDGGDPEDTLV